MCNQALPICANKYIFILNIYSHFYKYKCSNYKLVNVTVSENINICKPSNVMSQRVKNNFNRYKRVKI